MSQDDRTDWQLRQANEALQAKLAKCKRELCTVRQDLEDFSYAVSHDLREPLRMVCSYLELIEKRYAHALNEEGQEFLEYATEGAERLQAMLDGLLEYSRVTTRGQRLQAVDAGTVFRRAAASLERVIRETGAVITCDPLPTVHADPDQLGTVFRNLLENSLIFRGSVSPQIHISAQQEGAEWVFTIVDNGLGIDPRFHDRVFVVFQRVHGREYGGVGMGLAICKRIIERHGGRIWIDSQAGRGAKFFFTLPAPGAETP
ncbi:MAG: ATP-binding protein [Armatimonadetes bacterium]|nr:ATP-binding protein [Armatimonadota bacterium]